MTTDAGLLQLMWLASPALPVGGFSYSEGLESAIDGGQVAGEAQARDWLLDQLHLGVERSELPALAAAIHAWRSHDVARIAELNAWVCTTRESAEFRLQTEQMGRSLAAWLQGRMGDDDRLPVLASLRPAPTWPIAFALAGARSEAAPREVLLSFAFGWTENMVAAAVKAVPLGQTAGQRILSALVDAIPDTVERALQIGDSARQTFTPMLAVRSAQHETQYSRLFRS